MSEPPGLEDLLETEILGAQELPLIRPEPVAEPDNAQAVSRRADPQWAAGILLAGGHLVVEDLYSTGLAILDQLRRRVRTAHPRRPRQQADAFGAERKFRAAWQAASSRLLAPIEGGRLTLRKAPQIGWLRRLYPESPGFLLPFPQVQGLNSAWQWFERGVQLPTLPHKLHPFYGTYFPTRFEHLELLARWLTAAQPCAGSVIDVGAGCGVLAYQMSRAGFGPIVATDINPNAVMSMRLDLERNPPPTSIEPRLGDLLESVTGSADLIVFNPPWLAGEIHSELDRAIYYDNTLFERFFYQAEQRLRPGGRLVLLFSTLGATVGEETPHPVEQELEHGGRYVLRHKLKAPVGTGSSKTRRRRRAPGSEWVELWQLSRA